VKRTVSIVAVIISSMLIASAFLVMTSAVVAKQFSEEFGDQVPPVNSLAIQVYDKSNTGSSASADQGKTLGVNASQKLVFTQPTNTVWLFPYSGVLKYENSTKVPEKVLPGVAKVAPAILSTTSLFCPANSSTTSVRHGPEYEMKLANNISGVLYYDYHLPDINPENSNGTTLYRLSFWSISYPTTIQLPEGSKIFYRSEEICTSTTTSHWSNNTLDTGTDVVFYNIVFSLEDDNKTTEEPVESLSPVPDEIIQVKKSKEIIIVNADSSIGETLNKSMMTVNNVTFYREQHPTENISKKPGFGTLFFNYTIKNTDDSAFYAHVEIEAIVQGKRYPYQLVSGAMGEMLLPGENRDSWIAIQVPKEAKNVTFEIRDPRTQNIHWNIAVNLLQD
jgi:hypothetical protein